MLAVLEPERFDVAGQVIDRHQRLAGRPRRAPSRTTRRRAATRPGRGPGSPRRRRASGHADARVGERALDDPADVADVLARGQLRHDAAPLAMNLDLRGDDARARSPTGARGRRSPRRRRPPFRRTRSRCRGSRIRDRLGSSPRSGGVVVTQRQSSIRRAADAALGDDAGDERCGVTSKAGLRTSRRRARAAWRRRASPRARCAPRSGWPCRPACARSIVDHGAAT